MDIRPRTTGEILDDAWRLYRADAPVLLALSSLFAVPAVVSALLLLTQESGSLPWLLPAIAATLVLLTGLGSGACQEAFRLRAASKAVTLGAPLAAALRRGLHYTAGRGLVWGLTGVAAPVLLLPAWAVGNSIATSPLSADSSAAAAFGYAVVFLVACVTVPGLAALAGGLALHPILADGALGWFAGWREAVRQTQRQAGKAAAIALTRPVLAAIVAVNLHLLARIGLWIADDLAGFDLALAGLVLTPRNPAYVAVLALLTWLLLAPYFEATSYLLHVDARARHEGLDLWYRVQRWFPAGTKQVVGGVLLALAGLLVAASPLQADARGDAVRAVRTSLRRISDELKSVQPYPGSAHWEPALRALARRLEDVSEHPNGFRWFEHALDGFARFDRGAAVARLTDLERRLALLEESLPAEGPGKSREEIKALLPADGTGPRRPAPDPARPREHKPPRQDPLEPDPAPGPAGPGIVRPDTAPGGLDRIGWSLLLGLFLAALVIALLRARQRPADRPTVPKAAAVPTELTLAALLQQGHAAAGEQLWRQADELARAGRWLDGLRTLYLAVLALLHRADLIRFSATRTNGEYLSQLRPRTELYFPLESLTVLVEQKFYGTRHCQPDDYALARQLAEQLRGGIHA